MIASPTSPLRFALSLAHTKLGDNQLRLALTPNFVITLRLCEHPTALRDPAQLPKESAVSGSALEQVLHTLAQRVMVDLLRQGVAFYRVNPHTVPWNAPSQRPSVSLWSQETCSRVAVRVESLFLQYFLLVCSAQFEYDWGPWFIPGVSCTATTSSAGVSC